MTADRPAGPESAPRPAGASRRRLLNWFLGTSLGALVVSVFYPVLRFLSPPEIAEAPTNHPDPVDEGDYRAFSATCTHLACIVTYRPELRLIWCYCHNGVFDLTGKNIGGPPPRPLTPYEVHAVATPGGGPDTLVVVKA